MISASNIASALNVRVREPKVEAMAPVAVNNLHWFDDWRTEKEDFVPRRTK